MEYNCSYFQYYFVKNHWGFPIMLQLLNLIKSFLNMYPALFDTVEQELEGNTGMDLESFVQSSYQDSQHLRNLHHFL